MEILKVLLITILGTVAAGCIIGVLSGKHAVNKALSDRKPLLSRKERLVYLGLLLVGAACIAAGALWPSAEPEQIIDMNPGEFLGEEGLPGEEDGMEVFAENPVTAGGADNGEVTDEDDTGPDNDSADGETDGQDAPPPDSDEASGDEGPAEGEEDSVDAGQQTVAKTDSAGGKSISGGGAIVVRNY